MLLIFHNHNRAGAGGTWEKQLTEWIGWQFFELSKSTLDFLGYFMFIDIKENLKKFLDGKFETIESNHPVRNFYSEFYSKMSKNHFSIWNFNNSKI